MNALACAPPPPPVCKRGERAQQWPHRLSGAGALGPSPCAPLLRRRHRPGRRSGPRLFAAWRSRAMAIRWCMCAPRNARRGWVAASASRVLLTSTRRRTLLGRHRQRAAASRKCSRKGSRRGIKSGGLSNGSSMDACGTPAGGKGGKASAAKGAEVYQGPAVRPRALKGRAGEGRGAPAKGIKGGTKSTKAANQAPHSVRITHAH
ncbi:MAG: hypothetical protein J3K34DRAFT_426133 [Monoraphidium minutum]|nr:MAG: hypothetical protein J3K34DRAFT_426133 [Monoraphidium minutum]